MDITFESSGQLAVNEKNVIFNSLPETSEGISQGGNISNIVSFKLSPILMEKTFKQYMHNRY